MSLVIRPLTENDEAAFMEGVKLFIDMEREWFTFLWNENISFSEHVKTLIERANGINVPEGRVPDTMLYAFLDGRIIGRVNIRHELNDFLLKAGGHIGYAVASAYRQRGFATEMLKHSLIYCRDVLKLKRVLVTCDDDNLGSIKTIEKNGGILENILSLPEENKLKRRYWIGLE